MTYSKSFPRTLEGSSYPIWEEITLTIEEEKNCEDQAKKENIELMMECIDNAKGILEVKHLKPYQTDLVHMAVALFEKRSSHAVYFKEKKAKEKFDKTFS